MLFDIRDAYKAALSLERLTGVKTSVWLAENIKNAGEIEYSDLWKNIKRIIKKYNGHFPRIDDFEFVITHVTTSANKCTSILEDGIVDLKMAYQKKNSELRIFLESKGIDILLDSNCLKYQGKYFDISFEDCPWYSESEEHAAWLVGRKFYRDFTLCGFITINKNMPYGGDVHRSPEILSDLDKLLGTNLQEEWRQSHKAYEVVFIVPFRDIVYDECESSTEEDIVMSYLTEAYMCMSTNPETKVVLCKNGIEISPEQILECNRFTLWDRY